MRFVAGVTVRYSVIECLTGVRLHPFHRGVVDCFRGKRSITLTTLTSTGAAGTFSATLTGDSGSSAAATRVITEGVFNVTF